MVEGFLRKAELGRDQRTKGSPWPHCGKFLDGAFGVGNDGDPGPCPGAFSLCMDCGETSAFDDDLNLRKLTTEELADMQGSEGWDRIERARRTIRAVKDAMGKS